jgi:pimeloyl-ACP methyl ester carboxylesterase
MGFGGSVIGMLVWDLMRLTDYLTEELGVQKVACAGMSGGGQQTLWLTALDDRIAAAVTSGYFYGVKESLLKLPSNCDCNFVPFFWNTMDIGDLGALIAPRPLFVESGRADHLNGAPGLDNVYPQLETAKKAYRLWGAEGKVAHHIHEGGHQWVGTGLLDFLDGHLL